MTTEIKSRPAPSSSAKRSRSLFKATWVRLWMHFVGTGLTGRLAAWLVTWVVPPHYDRWALQFMGPRGFVAPSAALHGRDIHLGPHIFLDDHTLLYQSWDGGPIEIGASTAIARNTIIQTEKGGTITIGEGTRLQPHCFLSAAQGSIRIGAGVGIGPYCAFYPHDHGTVRGQPISAQPLVVKGNIVVEDEAWLGHGVTVLSGVTIGKGAVIGAGSTVASDVPDGAVAWGVPAKVFMKRKSSAGNIPSKDNPLTESSQTGKGAP